MEQIEQKRKEELLKSVAEVETLRRNNKFLTWAIGGFGLVLSIGLTFYLNMMADAVAVIGRDVSSIRVNIADLKSSQFNRAEINEICDARIRELTLTAEQIQLLLDGYTSTLSKDIQNVAVRFEREIDILSEEIDTHHGN